jgi:predicted Zn-dependent protease
MGGLKPELAAARAMHAQHAAALLATDPAAAERAAVMLLKAAPDDPRALLILGSAQRRQGKVAAARQVLEPLAKAYPRAANTQYEFGAALADIGERRAAITALSHAVSVNADLSDAWRLLGDLLFMEGDVAEAERAYAAHDRATVRDAALKTIADDLFHGKTEAGETALRAFLTARPNHAEGLRMLGEICLRQAAHADAEVLLAHALTLEPQSTRVRFSYATALFRQQKAALALQQVDHLLGRRPDDASYRNLQAACLGLLGETDRVVEIYESLAAQYPNQPGVWLNLGHARRTVGQREGAVKAYKRCLTLAPTYGEAYWSLANLKVVSFDPAEEAAMAAMTAQPGLAEEDRLHLHYALGKALEDRKLYAQSFQHYAEGARIRRGQITYDADHTRAFVDRCKAQFTVDFFEARAGGGSPSRAPIFIVGLPRAGSTLIEQILASHSEVEGTMELPEINLLARRLGGVQGDNANERYPAVLTDLNTDERRALGEQFIADTQIYRKSSRPRFIDKMPNNFQHIGLIQLILPNAVIVDVRRTPIASCFSAFKQHFNQGQNFSYDLSDLGRYYADYVDLMDHFDDVLPGRVLRVLYEDVVNDSEQQIRRLLDHCGLPFEARCLRFYENDRAVRTVSSEQVRRPIFRDGLDQWRRYEPFLDPLKSALGRA